jgi:transcriptional regulator with PAS, ATPase and Fis domain
MQELYFDYSNICDSLKQNPNAFFMAVDINGNIRKISQTLLDLLGLREEDALGKCFMDIVPDGKLLEVLKRGHIDEADTLSINGRDTVVTRIPIKKNQQVVGAFIYSLFFDISKAEYLIKEYQKNKPKFNRILDQVIGSPNMGYIVIDKEMKVTHVNQTYLDILGRSLEETIGRPIMEVSPYSKLPRVIETGLPDKVDVWAVNGNNMIVNRLPIMQNNEVIGAIGHTLVLDISVPKFLVNKLQETNLEFNVIFQGLIESPYAAYTIVDKDGYITVMNNTYLDIIKKRRSEVIGKHILDIMPHSKLLETLKSGRMDTADVWPIVEGRDIIVNRLPIKENGEIIGAIEHSLVLDISGAKILLKKLQETERELNLYKDEVRAMYHAKWTFDDLKGSSHEFITIKAMAKQFSQTSSTLLITGESGTGKELFAQAIHNASNRKNGPFIRINCAALQTTYTYIKFEPNTGINPEIFAYQVPEGYQILENNPGQLVATIEEAVAISGITPILPAQAPNRIIAFPDRMVLDYGNTTIMETLSQGDFELLANASLGTAGGGPLEVWWERLRWRQNGIEIQVEGEQRIALASQIAEDLSLPDSNEDLLSQAQVQVAVDKEMVEADQKQVDRGSSPWQLDPLQVSLTFVNLKVSPEGIQGEPEIPILSFKLVQNNSAQAVVEVADGPIKRVYLKRLLRQDETGIWSVVGYDPR